MQSSDRPKFLSALNSLCAAFRTEPSQPLFDGYWLALQSLPIEAVCRAVGLALGSSRRMPVPAELRELAGEEPAATKAVRAWAAVKDAIARVGAYESVDFGPAVNATIRTLGGWARLCGADSHELDAFIRKDFEKTFLAFNGRVSEELGRHLAGVFEPQNRLTGHAVRPPVRVEIEGGSTAKRLGPSKPAQLTEKGQSHG